MEYRFRLPVDFSKAVAEETEDERWLIKVKGSDTLPDRSKGKGRDKHGKEIEWKAERVTEKFIKKMQAQAETGQPRTIVFNDVHGKAIGFGKVIGHASKDRTEFVAVIELNKDFPESKVLFSEVKEKSCDKQASIGGTTTDAFCKFDKEISGFVKHLNDGYLDELTATHPKKAANPRSGEYGIFTKTADGSEREVTMTDLRLLDDDGNETTIEKLAVELDLSADVLRKSLETGEPVRLGEPVEKLETKGDETPPVETKPSAEAPVLKTFMVSIGDGEDRVAIPVAVPAEHAKMFEALFNGLQFKNEFFCKEHQQWHPSTDDCEQMRKSRPSGTDALALVKGLLADSYEERREALRLAVEAIRPVTGANGVRPWWWIQDFDDDQVVINEDERTHCSYAYSIDAKGKATIDTTTRTEVRRKQEWVAKSIVMHSLAA